MSCHLWCVTHGWTPHVPAFVVLGKGKPIHPGTKIECTKKHRTTKRLITKTPTGTGALAAAHCWRRLWRVWVLWLDAWEARRAPRYHLAPGQQPYRPPPQGIIDWYQWVDVERTVQRDNSFVIERSISRSNFDVGFRVSAKVALLGIL